jgi:hypothetical protein
LTTLYLAIVSAAESFQHAVALFWQDRVLVILIILGFGIQSALYVILKKRLFVPTAAAGSSGKLMGAGGATSTLAMVACCAHHIADVAPVLGLSAAMTFMAQYQTAFMVLGLGMNMLGIGVMVHILIEARRELTRIPITFTRVENV